MPAPFLRSLVAAYLNADMGKQYDIELNISENLEHVFMEGDEALLGRAINNLIGNSIRHNPSGCQIKICASLPNLNVCAIQISDNGTGIPKQVIQILEDNLPASSHSPHIMGLRIAKQIVRSHQGNFYFTKDNHGILMEFPITDNSPYNNRIVPTYDL